MRALSKLAIVFIAIFTLLAISKFSRTGSYTNQTLELPLNVQAISGVPVQPGKPTIVEFWATWCPPCRQTIPHLNSVFAEYGPKGLQIIGLTDESASTVLAFQKQVPMNYTVAQDQTRQYFQRFNIRGIPSMLLLDPQGKIVWQGHPAAFRPEQHLPALLN